MTLQSQPLGRWVRSAVPAHAAAYRHTGVVDGVELTVLYVVVDSVDLARSNAGIAGVTDECTLAALLELPEDNLGPLPHRFNRVFSDPATSEFAYIIDDPAGVRWGQRRLQVPIDVLDIEAHAQDWRRGADIAHRWVGYGPRTVRIDSGRDIDSDAVLAEATYYGIGLACGDSDWVLPPGRFKDRRWTAARWRFAEIIYDQFCQLSRPPLTS